jgi:hypothetical protein
MKKGPKNRPVVKRKDPYIESNPSVLKKELV